MTTERKDTSEKTFKIFILLSEQDNRASLNNATLAFLLKREMSGIEERYDGTTLKFIGCHKNQAFEVFATSECSIAHQKLKREKYDCYFFSINEDCFTFDIYEHYKTKTPFTILIKSTGSEDILYHREENRRFIEYLINKNETAIEKILFMIKLLIQRENIVFEYNDCTNSTFIETIRQIINEELPIFYTSERINSEEGVYLKLRNHTFTISEWGTTQKKPLISKIKSLIYNRKDTVEINHTREISKTLIKYTLNNDINTYQFKKHDEELITHPNKELKQKKESILDLILEHEKHNKDNLGSIKYLLSINSKLRSFDRDKIGKRIFISYANREENPRTAWNLAKDLVAAGIDARIDQYYPDLSTTWTEWMSEQFEKADYIIVLAHLYNTEAELKIEDRGRGSKHEKNLIATKIHNEYQNKGNVLFLLSEYDDPRDKRNLPSDWQGYQYYKYPSEIEKVTSIIKHQDTIN